MRRGPVISVIMPARNEGERVAATIKSLITSCAKPQEIEIVIVDDASAQHLAPSASMVPQGIAAKIVRSRVHLGVGKARNLAVRKARGDIVFITDAHVRFSEGWDREIAKQMIPNRILAATIREIDSTWHGFGCRLVVPYMGTHWINNRPRGESEVQVASSSGTVMERSTFLELGGYDEGMIVYGGFEPEFSLRAWRHGAQIIAAPGIEVFHRFKSPRETVKFIGRVRTFIVHNCLRFGVLHLPRAMILEMVRLQALEYRNHIQLALRFLEQRKAWERREELASILPRDFAWFVRHFKLTDQAGHPIPVRSEKQCTKFQKALSITSFKSNLKPFASAQ